MSKLDLLCHFLSIYLTNFGQHFVPYSFSLTQTLHWRGGVPSRRLLGAGHIQGELAGYFSEIKRHSLTGENLCVVVSHARRVTKAFGAQSFVKSLPSNV